MLYMPWLLYTLRKNKTKKSTTWCDILGPSLDFDPNEKEKGKVDQPDVGNKKDQQNSDSNLIQGQVKTARTKQNDQHLEQVIKITAHY